MRLILDTVINNSDLPLVDPAMQLVRPSALAVYDMLSNKDKSGNTTLGFSGTFSAEGAVLDTVDRVINTNVIEQDEISILICCNLVQRAGVAFSVVSNMTPATAPFLGFRNISTTSDSGTLAVATGLASPNQAVTITSQLIGAWTSRVLRIKNSEVSTITRSGTVTQAALTNRAKNVAVPIYVNALDASVAAGVKTGTTGTVGLFAAYSEYLSDSDAIGLMNISAQIMADRGVTLP
ncbi:hypothetical protein SAMN05192560_0787 [Methylobacillus rhizosphaerae]|uniref:Uncharacterized protein n=1 Tax=Methylobacillus rhizosphaerae TaxID=551994 RepID=A0A238YSC5_9PROT|nr:hypothetical protein [Methylobacillus rhizosphaerae]SNR73862.1 hypothetical protein SAMN05192560_0787 [Methylobacillus rhizosphaerae]